MATVHTGVSGGIANHFQTYYSKKVLPHAVQATILAQFGQKTPYPTNTGNLTMGWMRPTESAVSSGGVVAEVNTVTLGSSSTANQEGIPVATFRDQTWTLVTKVLSQYTEATKITDVMSWAALYDALELGIMVMGEDVALHMDSLIRNELVGALYTLEGTGRRYPVGTTQTYAGMRALTGATGTISITDVLDGMTYLTIKRAPKLNGEFIFVAPPPVVRDVLNDKQVVLAGQYGTSKSLMNGEAGSWYGVRVLTTTNAFVQNAATTPEATPPAYDNTGTGNLTNTGKIYWSFLMGSDGFGIPNLATGGSSPFGPKVYVCDKAEKSDPANQFITAALKTFWCVKTLNPNWICALNNKSTFAG